VDAQWPRASSLLRDNTPDAPVALIGVPTHTTSLSPTQAQYTPAAVRDALARFGTWFHGGDLTDLRVFDAGDVPEPDRDPQVVIDRVRSLSAAGSLVIALGGDNAATYGVALGSCGEALTTAGLITLDAHHDLRDGVSNGSPVRQLVEAGFNPHRIVQIGIADFANSPAYSRRAAEWGITVITRADLRTRSMTDALQQAMAVAGAAGGPVHVDLDVDVCDRSVAPGCPASVPGGLSADALRQAARWAGSQAQVRSIDITEVDARADAADHRTVRLAALCVLEALAGFQQR
jgi:formiminoglutamase